MAGTVWRGQLTFGLVSIPVRLFRAARKERVQMHYVRQSPATEERGGFAETASHTQRASAAAGRSAVPDDEPAPQFEPEEPVPPPAQVTRIKQNLVGAGGEEPVSRAEVAKGYEYAPQQYVVFEKEELRRVRPKTSTEMQIVRSVRLSEVDPVYFETSYFVVPDREGERAYALLLAALRKTGHVALAKVAMHGSEHIVLIRPGRHGLLAHTMFFQDEIRAENEFRTPDSSMNEKELEVATAFVDAISAAFAPEEFKDSYRERVQALIAGKIVRGEVAASGPPVPPPATPPVDILEALKKSIALAKKPAKKAEAPVGRKATKVMEMPARSKRRKA
jgi:DNA end-binding protein Ku